MARPPLRAGPGGGAELTILYFNDLHGHLVPFTHEGDTAEVGGAARMATLVELVRTENRERGRPTLLVEGGDIFQGTPLSSVFKGEPDYKFLNMIGLDAMVLGNHEFDFGLEVLRQRIAEANFPVLAANVRWKDGGELFATPYVLRTLSNGLRVAILGFVTDETPETTDPMNVEELVFEPPILAATRYVSALEDSADVLLALTHIGSRQDRLLADTHDELDVIVGGHDQVLIHRPLEQDDVIITQAEEYGLYLGRVDLLVESDGEVELVGDTVYAITADLADDPRVAAMVAGYTRRLDRELSRIVGRLTTPLEGDRHVVRRRQTNFGRLLTDVMRERTQAAAAVINSGSIRDGIGAGPVTLGEVLQALPFANHVMTVQLSGEAVERLLAQSAQSGERGDSGGFLQLSGIELDPAGCSPRGTDPCVVRVGGEALDPAALYTIALTDFLFSGGDGYELFRRIGRNPRDTGILLAQAVTDHIRRNSPLSAPEPLSASRP